MSPHRKQHFLIACVFLFVAVLALVATNPSSPDGRYVASSAIGAVGDWYYEFAGGKASLVIHEYEGSPIRDQLGVYFKTNGAWVFFAGKGMPRSNAIPTLLKSSWFGVSLSATNNSREFCRRRLIPGSRPDWMLRWLPWSIQ